MAHTTNFNWETPDDTDLVKDGAAAIRTLGNSIDTSFIDLKGGTTGQILSKASNTDLDYTWIANDQGDITEVSAGTGISVASGTGPVPVVTNTVATTFDAKGDLVVGTGADTFAKLAVGTNGYTLVADSVEATGLKWAAPAGASYTWTSYSPTWTNLTVGNGTVTARYVQIDKLIIGYIYLDFGTTTSISGRVQVSVPVNFSTNTPNDVTACGVAYFEDAGVNSYFGSANAHRNSQTLFVDVLNVGSTYPTHASLSSTVPFTWGNDDRLGCTFTYEGV